MAHSVELPADVTPRFPDRCVVCGRPTPGDQLEVSAMFNGQKPLGEPVARLHRATIPACAGCQAALIRSRWIGKAIMGVAIAIAVAIILAVTQLGWAAEGWRSYALIVLAVLVPFVGARMIYSPHLDLFPWSDRLVFEFRDRGYAEAFAALNEQRGARLR